MARRGVTQGVPVVVVVALRMAVRSRQGPSLQRRPRRSAAASQRKGGVDNDAGQTGSPT